MQGSYGLVGEIVEGLIDRLSCRSSADLDSIFSVYVSGSYVRGDFLESNSDLDLSVVFRPGGDRLLREDPSYKLVQSEVQGIIGGRSFHSHTPGGVDWEAIRWDWLPTPKRGPSIPGPAPYYAPFGIFLFDLHRYLKVCWGEDPRPHLVEPPDPVSMATAWYEHSLERLNPDYQRVENAASGAFKSLQVAQIIFGEPTLDKTRLPTLYEDVVPGFPMKEEGARLIHEVVQARYPDHPPHFDTASHYRELVTRLWAMIQEERRL